MLTNLKFEEVTDSINSAAKILILDDDPDIRASLRDLLALEDKNYYVETTENVAQTMSLIEYFSPDLALIDVRLGGNSGLDLLPVLKVKFPDIICIIITGYKDVEFAVKALRHGADNYLYKPLEPVKFLQTVNQYISKQKRNRQQKEADQRLRAVFEKAFHLTFVVSDEGKILDVNNTDKNFLLLSKQEAIGNNIWSDTVWPINPLTSRRIKSVFEKPDQNSDVHQEITLVNTTGESVVLDMYIKPLSYENGAAVSFLVQCSDITSRKEVEKHLQDLVYYDSATHLPKGNNFLDVFKLESKKAERSNKKIVIGAVTLGDLFALYNKHGYKTGTQVIIEVATRLGSLDDATCLRFSEDTFVFVQLLDFQDAESVSNHGNNIVSGLTKSISLKDEKIEIDPHVQLSLSIPTSLNDASAEKALRMALDGSHNNSGDANSIVINTVD
ncbi:MAG: response regulator [Gammaproteobacteria bacterium]|nr:response regulator [Gammaproteobacteria bacterium]MDH5692092.1 response regulator [Gammaproteobacteria bacterium]